MQGQLGEKLLPDLVRKIAQQNSSGLLRLSRGKAIKAIFFEDGAPTFAISNITSEQLDHKLVKEGLLSFESIDQARQRAGKTNRLGPVLVEMGLLEDAQMRELVRDQAMAIILSLFEWTEGDYAFDPRIRAAHEVTLKLTPADLLLEGARRAAEVGQAAEALVPHDGVVSRSRTNGLGADSGRLIPIESYVLSRIESPTPVSEVGALSGLGEEDARRAVCALVAAGFLNLAGRGDEVISESGSEDEESLELLREDVARKLHFSTSGDYYDVLGVTRQATTAEVKSAYYHLAKKYHPDRYGRRDVGDLRNKLEALFSLMTQAYDTLNQPSARAAYDEKIRSKDQSRAAAASGSDSRKSGELRVMSGDLQAETPAEIAEPALPAAAKPSPEATPLAHKSERQLPPAQMAELYYNQGRARFERKEYHAAVHLLREAIKLDPTRAAYHFHLGIALIRNPRTRREAEGHLSKAAELEPYNAQIRAKLGLLYKEAGLHKRAEHYFHEALQLDPDNRVARRETSGDLKPNLAQASIWKADVGTIAKRIFKK